MNNAKAKKDCVIWCDNGWFPYHYGFCPNKKAWDREMKRLNIVPRPPYPDQQNDSASARCTHFVNAKDHNACTIVTVKADRRSGRGKVGMLVHEAMHVWRAVRENIGETHPSSEFEAYAMQSITQSLIQAFELSRSPLCKKKAR